MLVEEREDGGVPWRGISDQTKVKGMLSGPSRGLKGILKASKEQESKTFFEQIGLIADPVQIDRGLGRVDSFFLGRGINETKGLKIDQL